MFLFYGIGGGLFMRVSLTTAVVIALGFFAVEAAASRLWLVRFRYGPVEWVWRQVTYWKRVPLRRTTESALPTQVVVRSDFVNTFKCTVGHRINDLAH